MLKWCYIAVVVVVALVGGVWWMLSGEDPRELALGEWKEGKSRLRVEVRPEQAEWRGMGHGRLKYEWVQTEKSPYLVRFTYHGETFEAAVEFDGKDTAIVEPRVWHKLPGMMQQQIREHNRRHNRPETELKLVLRREVEAAK